VIEYQQQQQVAEYERRITRLEYVVGLFITWSYPCLGAEGIRKLLEVLEGEYPKVSK